LPQVSELAERLGKRGQAAVTKRQRSNPIVFDIDTDFPILNVVLALQSDEDSVACCSFTIRPNDCL
jgi:hypothetical protein